MPQTSTGLKGLARVILTVRDQDAAIDFYVNTLGLDLLDDIPFGEGDRWVEVGFPGAPTVIALARPMGIEPDAGTTCVSFGTPDVEALHAELRERGVDVDDVMRPGDPAPPMFFFRDPDGNALHAAEEA
jgi:catechol 2,3-dioxygenase-like lactoylglutathione lyase family enzyme